MTSLGRQTFLVERYAADLSIDQLLLAGRRAEEAAPATVGEMGTRYLGSVLLPLDEMALCLFEGSSEEVVRVALEQGFLAFERMTPAVPATPRSHASRRGASNPTSFDSLRPRLQTRPFSKETPR